MKSILLIFHVVVFTAALQAQNENLRQYLYTRKDYVNNQLRNRDSAVYSYPNPSERLMNEETWYLWNIPGQVYHKDTRNLFTYDASGKTIEQITQKWDGNSWINSTKVIQTYNAQGLETQYSSFYFQNNNWIEYSRSERTYNAQGISTELQVSDTTGGSLNVRYRISWTVDVLQRNVESVTQVNVSGNLINDNRTLYYYTGNSTRPDSLYFYSWTNNNWLPSTKQIKKYDTQGNEIEYLRFNLSTNKPTIKTVYDYNAFGLQILSEDSTWSLNNNQWAFSSKQTITYDSKNRKLERINYQSAQGSPVFNSKTTYSYAPDSSTVQLTLSGWINNSWQANTELTYFFELRQFTSDLNGIENSSIRVFPNPFSNVAIIEFDSEDNGELLVQITDASGRTVFQKSMFAISEKDSILWDATDADGNALPSGLYVATIQNRIGKQTFKLLKQ